MPSHPLGLEREEHWGKFITFEGGEGVGKTTQISMLAKRLAQYGIASLISREPGGTPGAEAVRRVLLDKAALESFGPRMEAILLSAARNDHVSQVIRPALSIGKTVILDRFMDSTRVYQGASNSLDPAFLGSLERVAIDGMMPDLTLVLDLDPLEGLQRAAARRSSADVPDRFEKETVDVHEKRRDAFRAIAAKEPDRCKLVDASGDAEAVHERLWPFVADLLTLETRKAAKLANADR